VRVIGHELNNSLAPIKSIAGSLNTMLRRPQRADDWEQDMTGGLEIIESRAEGLNRFMQSYARLAKLPAPVRQPVELSALLRRIVTLGTRSNVVLIEGPEIKLSIDVAQVEQVVINLVKNAVEAVEETNTGNVRVTWRKLPGQVEIAVEDNGPGIASAQNLFVPFFTTKPSGSGIGLVLCRQIAENHGGALTLENREATSGCIARLRLPV
jgi:signal transduction histidine kinase